jgi:hypothetical protein
MSQPAPVERVTIQQLATELGIDKSLASRMLREGKGPGIPLGHRILILRPWVEQWKETLPSAWITPTLTDADRLISPTADETE